MWQVLQFVNYFKVRRNTVVSFSNNINVLDEFMLSETII